VDHDPAVIEATARVYPAGADTLLDQRLTVLSGSAEDFLAQSVHERYDIIVNDAFDLAEVDSTLPDDLYEAITRFLTDDGVCSDMIYRSIYEADRFSPAMRRVKEQPRKAISLLCVPEHPGFLHVLSLWGRNRRLAQSFKISANPEQRRIRDAHGYRYFDPDNMPYYLYSPPYLADYIK
jgi:spermidine synthase